MRKTFEQSAETTKLVALFRGLNYSQKMSFDEASRLVGFRVTSVSPSYQSAKRIAERDFKVYIASVRKFGFVRGTGEDMVGSGVCMLKSMRNTAKRTSSRMLLAINENLDEANHRLATEMYGRANIVAATTAPVRASSNKNKPDAGHASGPFDLSAALKSVGMGR
jgi:hypothetical protein